jgi:hypothetical protein
MFKILVALGIILSVFSVMSILVPDKIVDEIDNSIVYFLTYVWQLNNIINVSAFMGASLLVVDFYISLAVFWVVYWIINYIMG